mmetsp:Transcript_1069/g.2500  ORF Transcript_1069/g.2500 Transcript_1069/m.2500 type:complete len:237 (+) Transcript_1069:114-824(+)
MSSSPSQVASPAVIAQVVSVSVPAMMAHIDADPPHVNHASDPEQMEAATRDPAHDETEHGDDNGSESHETTTYEASPPPTDAQMGKIYMSLDVGAILEKHRIQNEEALTYIDRSTHSVPAQTTRELEECMICLEDMAPGHLVSSLPCNHTFHYECIANWLQTKLMSGNTGCCPSCNLRIIVPVIAPPAEIVVPIQEEPPRSSCCGHPLTHTQRNRAVIFGVCALVALLFILSFMML